MADQTLMSERTFIEIFEACAYPGFRFELRYDGLRPYLQIVCDGTCNLTQEPLTWTSRKWPLSIFMTKSEVVQTCFKATMTAIEHEVRELFKYRGASIFGPHYDVDKLVELCARPDALDERPAAA